MAHMFRLSDPRKRYSFELVLLDSDGSKIQVSIRKLMLRRFNCCVEEGRVYRMSFFGVIPNFGSYRATTHEYKLLLHGKTTIIRCVDEAIPLNNRSFGYEFSADVMGVLTVVSNECNSEKNRKTT
ncbi:hypothetical protein JHK85_045253 [Glycine max]|uniref:Replication protein A 70 kDa DNA-binding subunit B/D first OB fold domain-containing protein n=1 Tax=Glycine soja TaxID=3848 RepID=A0A445GFQ1_GLYSO|nr:hypothetical protein JHK86_044644 [Glycine max]KAG4951386.1 hypothetical protein JHK85_045253 [Glycine max]RZB60003.1 hypothetical protein D0Y65_042971 [Glycine soja]